MKEYIVLTFWHWKKNDTLPIAIIREGQELIRCNVCEMNPYNKPANVNVVHGTPDRCYDLASRKNAFCSEGKRMKKK